MEKELLFVFIGATFALAGGLVKSIIWDWLNKGKEKEKPSQQCSEHPSCVKKMESTENCLNHLKRDLATFNAGNQEWEKNIGERLRQGDERMNKIADTVNSIDIRTEKLLTIIEERTGRGVFQPTR